MAVTHLAEIYYYTLDEVFEAARAASVLGFDFTIRSYWQRDPEDMDPENPAFEKEFLFKVLPSQYPGLPEGLVPEGPIPTTSKRTTA